MKTSQPMSSWPAGGSALGLSLNSQPKARRFPLHTHDRGCHVERDLSGHAQKIV